MCLPLLRRAHPAGAATGGEDLVFQRRRVPGLAGARYRRMFGRHVQHPECAVAQIGEIAMQENPASVTRAEEAMHAVVLAEYLAIEPKIAISP